MSMFVFAIDGVPTSEGTFTVDLGAGATKLLVPPGTKQLLVSPMLGSAIFSFVTPPSREDNRGYILEVGGSLILQHGASIRSLHFTRADANRNVRLQVTFFK